MFRVVSSDGLVSDPLVIFLKTLARFLIELLNEDLEVVIFKRFEHRSFTKVDDIIATAVVVHGSPQVLKTAMPSSTRQHLGHLDAKPAPV